MPSWTIGGTKFETEAAGASLDELLNAGAEKDAQDAGTEDGKAMIPEGPGHAPFVRKLAEKGNASIELLGGRRARADAEHSSAQWAAYVEYQAAKADEESQHDPMGPTLRWAVAAACCLASVGAAYLALHEVANPARALMAVGFAAVFTVGAYLRLGLGRYGKNVGVRPVAGDVLTAVALSTALLVGVASEWTLGWTPVRWATSALISGVLTLSWFVVGFLARSHPPIATAVAGARRREAERIYLDLSEKRRALWQDHTRQGHALVARAAALMHTYYAANLQARRNSLSSELIEATAEALPEVPSPAWIEDHEPNFDPAGLGKDD